MYILILYATLIDAVIRLFTFVSIEYVALEKVCMTWANFIVLFMFISLTKVIINYYCYDQQLYLYKKWLIVNNYLDCSYKHEPNYEISNNLLSWCPTLYASYVYFNIVMCHSLQNDVNIV